jgi:hypothetical protein
MGVSTFISALEVTTTQVLKVKTPPAKLLDKKFGIPAPGLT